MQVSGLVRAVRFRQRDRNRFATSIHALTFLHNSLQISIPSFKGSRQHLSKQLYHWVICLGLPWLHIWYTFSNIIILVLTLAALRGASLEATIEISDSDIFKVHLDKLEASRRSRKAEVDYPAERFLYRYSST